MSSINDIRSSKFLKKEDVGKGVLVTIRSITQENVAQDGADVDMKFALHLDEFEKPMVLNSTNAQIIAKITGKEDNIEESWIGTRIVLYNDPTVSFAGKLIGGLRVRAVKKNAVIPAKPEPAPEPEDDGDGLPF